jgi:hypothetical protein
MPEFSTLAGVDLGFGAFGSGITCYRTFRCGRRLASAERAQADGGQCTKDSDA